MKRVATFIACLLLCHLELSAHSRERLSLSGHRCYRRFSDVRLPEALRITPSNEKPALFAFSEYPADFHTDGYLYVAPWSPGRIRLERLKPDGKKSIFIDVPIDPRVARKPGKHEGGLLAVASGPNGFLYVSDGASMWKINSKGLVSTVVENIMVSACPHDLPAELPQPHIRSLAVNGEGDIYAAAIGCRAVLRITPSGQITSVLRAASPWSPCAVTIAAGDVYVMEYDNPRAERPADGRPRIRKITRSGQVLTLHVAEQAKR